MTAPRPPACNVAYNDLASLAAIAAQGFDPWGQAVTVGEQITTGFAHVTGASAAADGTLTGFLILSLSPRLIPPADWTITGHSGALNLGCLTIRYPAPARVGAALQGRRKLLSAREHPRGTLLTLAFEVREEGAQAPCLTAQSELLYLGGRAQ